MQINKSVKTKWWRREAQAGLLMPYIVKKQDAYKLEDKDEALNLQWNDLLEIKQSKSNSHSWLVFYVPLVRKAGRENKMLQDKLRLLTA